jgi:hexosaminidase
MLNRNKDVIFGMIAVVLVLISVALTNPKPTVIPSLQIWTSGLGRIKITPNTMILVDPRDETELDLVARTFQTELAGLTGLNLASGSGEPGWGDIYLTLDTDDIAIGEEGYIIELGSSVRIRAHTADGVFQGTRTILQILKQDSKLRLPRGEIRDFPRWKVRGFMLDAGRMYFPIEELIGYVKLLSWYKMNEFHIHLNDNQPDVTSLDDYSAFRLESSTYPGLAAGDGYYTKQEWQELEAIADLYGVTILPEIDTPAHALAFTSYRPDLAASATNLEKLDASSPETMIFVNNLWGEFLPIFTADTVQIGADEYIRGDDAVFQKYVRQMLAFMDQNGKKVRVWGSHPILALEDQASKLVLDLYDYKEINPREAVEKNFYIVNVIDIYMYIVPDAGYYREYLDTQWLYGEWQPNIFGSANYDLDPSDPHLLGAKFCVWNDKLGVGYDTQDVYQRVRPSVQTLSEILWNDGSDTSYLKFTQLWQKIGDAPGTSMDYSYSNEENNIAAGGFAYSSSIENGSPNIAARAIDGNPGTLWKSDYSDDQWLKIDLNGRYDIRRIRIDWGDAFAESYRIQTSTDGIFWVTTATIIDFQGGVSEISLSRNNVRYVRLLADKASTQWGFTVNEFEIFIDE